MEPKVSVGPGWIRQENGGTKKGSLTFRTVLYPTRRVFAGRLSADCVCPLSGRLSWLKAGLLFQPEVIPPQFRKLLSAWWVRQSDLANQSRAQLCTAPLKGYNRRFGRS